VTKQSLVSIVVPSFNASRWVRDTIESAKTQRYDLEIIVVDDGSTDDTAAIVESNFPAARLIRTPNLGASHARNTGTQAATGEFIQYLDADDLLAEGKIRAQIEALEKSGADVAYGDWQKLVPAGDGFMPGEVIARTMREEPALGLFGAFWCPPAAYLFRRSIVERVGAWNEDLPVIQDARFALDCALHGGRFVYCKGLMAYYRVHEGGSLSRRDSKSFHRDVYRNAQEVESWWREHGGVNERRQRALVSCFGYVARASYEQDPVMFETAVADLERLDPNYAPDRPLHLKMVSKLIGYRRAEGAAARYRRARRSLSGGSK